MTYKLFRPCRVASVQTGAVDLHSIGWGEEYVGADEEIIPFSSMDENDCGGGGRWGNGWCLLKSVILFNCKSPVIFTLEESSCKSNCFSNSISSWEKKKR